MNTLTKYEVQAVTDGARDKILTSLQAMQQENQAMFRQVNAERDQLWRKVIALQTEIAGLRREVRTLSGSGTGAERVFQPSSDLPVLPLR